MLYIYKHSIIPIHYTTCEFQLSFIHALLTERDRQYRDTSSNIVTVTVLTQVVYLELECGLMPNVMAALTNIGGTLCSTQQSLADAHCWSTVQ